MKKVIYWILFVLGLTAAVLCFVFPVQAKEVSENIMNVLNTPVGIAGVSTTIGGILAFVVTKFIMTNSKFGRKELDNMKKEYEEFQNIVCEHEAKVTQAMTEYENKFEDLKNNCNNQVTIMLEQFEDLQKDTLNALKAIPNKKVQAIVEQYEAQYAVKKQEVIEKTINTNEYINEKIKELEEMLNEAKETFNFEAKAA